MNKLPIFEGNNVINVEEHIKKFIVFLQIYTHSTNYNHEDVRMKLFVLSIEGVALTGFMIRLIMPLIL